MHDHAAEAVGGRFVAAKQVQEADAEHGEVLGGVARSGAAGVFAEDDVEAPVTLVFDAPVLADGVGDGGGVGGEAAEEEGGLGGLSAVGKAPGAVEAHKGLELRPLVFFEEEGEVGGDPAATGFQASVVFPHLLEVGGACGGDVVHDCANDALVRGVVAF